MALFVFVVLFMMTPAFAIETTKASALFSGEMREDYTLSRSPDERTKSSRSTQTDPCLSYLQAHHSPDAQVKDLNKLSNNRPSGRTEAVPVALGFMLGYRIALGPQETTKTQNGIQHGAKIQRKSQRSNPRALAIAAYRGCKNEMALKL